jgi:hypothetical protein
MRVIVSSGSKAHPGRDLTRIWRLERDGALDLSLLIDSHKLATVVIFDEQAQAIDDGNSSSARNAFHRRQLEFVRRSHAEVVINGDPVSLEFGENLLTEGAVLDRL